MRDKTLVLRYLRDFFGVRVVYLPSRPSPLHFLEKARAAAERCRKCELYKGRNKLVFGWGNPFARLMLVGEAPGADEDRLGKPFVGAAGKLLTEVLAEAGLDRERDLYIANTLKCRPPRNRDPLPQERAACWPFLKAQIRVIDPELLVAMGRHAAAQLLGLEAEQASISSLRKRIHRGVLGKPVLVTYHPAAATRRKALRSLLLEDFKRASQFLGI